MDAYCAEIRKLEDHFERIELQHVASNNNMAADVLSKLGSRRVLVLVGVFVQDLHKSLIKLLEPDNLDQVQRNLTPAPPRDVLMTEKEDDWCGPFLAFLLDSTNESSKMKPNESALHSVVLTTSSSAMTSTEKPPPLAS
jgi:hypothetical protein